MMLSSLIHKAHALKEQDAKASFFVAKEIAIIELNMMWYPEKMADHVARMHSLANHIMTAFKHSDNAKVLTVLMKHKALLIESKSNNPS